MENDETSTSYHGRILGFAGKSTGKHKDWVNVQHEAPDTVAGKTGCYNWRTDIRSWRYVPDHQNGTDYETVHVTSVDEFSEAKRLELLNWRENGVFEEVDFRGQQLVSVRWVLTVKDDGTRKARLVAR